MLSQLAAIAVLVAGLGWPTLGNGGGQMHLEGRPEESKEPDQLVTLAIIVAPHDCRQPGCTLTAGNLVGVVISVPLDR